MKTYYYQNLRVSPGTVTTVESRWLASRVKSTPVWCAVLFLVLMSVDSALAADTNENAGQFSPANYKFMRDAATGGMTEVRLANIAATNSQNIAVRRLAQRMVNDNGKAGQDLAAIASRKGATLPMRITAEQRKDIAGLASLSGVEFDHAYIAFMVRSHKIDEAVFKAASQNAPESELKTFAADTLITVQDHLKMAQDIEGTFKRADVLAKP